MANKEINLLPTETYLEQEKVARSRRKSITLGLILVIIFFLLNLTLFLYAFSIKIRASKVEEETKNYENAITNNKDKEMLLFGVKTKLSSLEKYYSSPFLVEFLDKVLPLFPTNSTVKGLTLDLKSLDTSVITSSSGALDEILTNLATKEKGLDLFSNLDMNSLASEKLGVGYDISFKGTLK